MEKISRETHEAVEVTRGVEGGRRNRVAEALNQFPASESSVGSRIKFPKSLSQERAGALHSSSFPELNRLFSQTSAESRVSISRPAGGPRESMGKQEPSQWVGLGFDQHRIRRLLASGGEPKDVTFVRLRLDYEHAAPNGDNRNAQRAGMRCSVYATSLDGISASDPSWNIASIFGKGAETVGECIATELDQLSQPMWERWNAPYEQLLANADQSVASLQQILHDGLLGIPTERVLSGVRVPFAVQISFLAEQMPVKAIDGVLGPAERFIEVVGIVIGVLSGHPILVCACFKALMHNEVHHLVASEVTKIIEGDHGKGSVGRTSSQRFMTSEHKPTSPSEVMHLAEMRAPAAGTAAMLNMLQNTEDPTKGLGYRRSGSESIRSQKESMAEAASYHGVQIGLIWEREETAAEPSYGHRLRLDEDRPFSAGSSDRNRGTDRYTYRVHESGTANSPAAMHRCVVCSTFYRASLERCPKCNLLRI